MHKKVIFSLILLLNCHLISKAQDAPVSPIYENIIPPSPEAGNLGKYGDTPISYNTGTPNISVPLYEIKGKELNLPISLSYDSKGTKVQDIASWVGLGWSLNAGGVIARTVRGKPDETGDGYFYRLPHWLEVEGLEYDILNYINHPKYEFENRVALGEYDLIPDAYNFSFGNYSGTITFKYEGGNFHPIVSPFQDIKIEGPFDQYFNVGDWTITTPDGTKYTFANAETTGSHKSAWYLSSIVSASGKEKISFNYSSNGSHLIDYSKIYNVSTVSLRKKTIGEECLYPSPSMEQQEAPVTQTIYLNSINFNSNIDTNSENLFIDLISSPGRNCEYIYSLTPSLRTLDSLRINKVSQGETKTLKSFSFNYDVFGNPLECTSKNRLKLVSVTESGKLPYLFDYNSDALPEYNYMSDHWGYWNGQSAPANSSFVPSPPHEYFVEYVSDPAASANRETSIAHSKVGLINKITYPTGGYSLFDFEGHIAKSYQDNYSLSQYATITAYGDEALHGDMSTAEMNVRNLWDDGDTQLVGGLPNVKVVTFTINASQNVFINASITSPDGSPAFPTFTRLYEGPIDKDSPRSFINGGFTYLPQGTYSLVAAVAEGQDNIIASMNIQYYELVNNYPVTNYYGGARIKRITDVSPNDPDNPIVTDYKYITGYVNYLKESLHNSQNTITDVFGNSSLITNEPASSAIIHHIPKYFEKDICENQLIVSASNSNPYGLNKGHHIGYSEVTSIKSGGESGATVYKYNNSSNPDVRNLIKEVSHYDKDLNLVQKTETQYEDYYGQAATGRKFKVFRVQMLYLIGGSMQVFHHFSDNISETNYNYSSFWRAKTKEINYTYHQGIAHETETTFKYLTDQYNFQNQKHYQLLIEQKEQVNRGHLSRQFTYPPQLTDDIYALMVENNAYQRLVKSSMVFIPNTGEESIIDAIHYDYSEIGTFYKPHQEQKLNTETNQLEKNRLFKYDDYGNIIEVDNVRSGIKTAYLWDSNRRNLVAEIVNASPDEVDYCSFEKHTNSNWDIGSEFETDSLTKSGARAKSLLSGSVNYNGPLVSGSYILELYAKNGTIKINNSNEKSAGDSWERMVWEIDGTPFSISGTAIIDEVRIMPNRPGVNFNSFYTEDYIGIRTITDTNGLTQYFDYDNNQRLEFIWDNQKNLKQKIQYQYQNGLN